MLVYTGSYITGVSGQPIGPTLKDPVVQEEVMLIACDKKKYCR